MPKPNDIKGEFIAYLEANMQPPYNDLVINELLKTVWGQQFTDIIVSFVVTKQLAAMEQFIKNTSNPESH